MTAAGADSVLTERRDRKLYVTLNRPAVLNAQNQAMRVGLVAAIKELDGDPELLVCVMTGIGGRAFSVGRDLKELPPPDPQSRPSRPQPNSIFNVHFEAVRWAAKPVIAAIDGHCVGGGLELANHCDIRIATGASTFGQPEPRTVGVTGGPALFQLPRLLPLGEALLMQLTSQPMSAQRAYELGLIQRLCSDREALMREADAIADQMIACNPEALRVVKRVVKWGQDMTTEQVEKLHFLADESRWSAMQSSDWKPSWNRD